MAMIDVGGGSRRRAVNQELTLVPFIDFLLCIVAFLLVTAVWSQMARLEARASVPGDATEPAPDVLETVLHVDMRKADRFALEWRQGNTVLSRGEVVRKDDAGSEGIVRYPALAIEVERLWKKDGRHRAIDDRGRDRAVLHAGNTAPFEEIVASMDAIRATSRPGDGKGSTPAFDVVFAAD